MEQTSNSTPATDVAIGRSGIAGQHLLFVSAICNAEKLLERLTPRGIWRPVTVFAVMVTFTWNSIQGTGYFDSHLLILDNRIENADIFKMLHWSSDTIAIFRPITNQTRAPSWLGRVRPCEIYKST